MRKLELFGDDYESNAPKTHYNGARGIIHSAGKIVLLHYALMNHYTLPGGQIEPNEDAKTALHREILEETGYQIKAVEPVLELTEHFTDSIWNHHFFYAEIASEQAPVAYTDAEKTYGISLHTYTPYDALALLSEHVGDDPYSSNIMTREFLGLSEAIAYMSQAKIL